MTDTDQQLMDAFDARVERRNDRRDFFKAAIGAAAVAGAGVAAVSVSGIASAQAITDADVLNFALNLEYLEAQFYSYAVFGTGLSADKLTGTTAPGTVIGGQAVPFQDTAVRNYAREIARDEIAHVDFLRSQLGGSRVSMPNIDIGGTDPNGAFSKAAQAAGLAPAGTAFNPYASDNNFLLGAFIFEDVGVTAYKGAAPLITNKNYLEAAAGILAVEAYHAAIVRTTLYAKGLLTQADAISNARDSLDGTSTSNAAAQDKDQGLSPSQGIPATSGATIASNIVPLDANGLAYSRTTGQVLNIVYLNSSAVRLGGFFPNGVNGTLNQSAASNTPVA